MGRRSGIRIYKKEENRKKRGKERRLSLWILQWLCTSFLTCAWWNAFLSVFPSGIGRTALFCTVFLAGAVLHFLNLSGWKLALPVLGVCLAAALWPGRELFTELFSRIAESVSFAVNSGSPGTGGGIYAADSSLRMGAAAALAAVPVMEIWLLVLKTGKGRIPAGLLVTAPLLGTACGGFFSTASSAWLLILAGGVYFACGTAGGGGRQVNVSDGTASGGHAAGKNASDRRMPGSRRKLPGREAWTAAFMALVILTATAVLASRAGSLLDRGRDVPGGYYQTARSFLTTELVGTVEEMIYGPPQEQETPGEQDTSPDPETPEDTPDDMRETDAADGDGTPVTPGSGADIPAVDFTGEGSGSGSSMDHLKDLEAYMPSDAELSLGVILEERPTETVYYPLRYGLEYRGDSWEQITEEDIQNSVTSFPWGMYLEDCRVWPDDLERLSELCEGWEGLSVGEVGSQIDEAFAELAVYDTHPGATPDDQDFVEYFLFENHRGFCVHFASAATLLYRMSGCTAVYVEGYAIPPSAFTAAGEDGPYTAQIDGTMGHAWCETFDEQTSRWTVREHTPAASGVPGGHNRTEDDGAGLSFRNGAGRILIRAAAVVAALILAAAAAWAVLAVQAAVRRKRKEAVFQGKSAEKGIAAMYQSIRQAAARQGVNTGDPYGESTPALLAEAFPVLDAEEWAWLCGCAVKNLFYHLDDPEEDRTGMYRLYTRFIREIYSGLGRRERFLYRYIYNI